MHSPVLIHFLQSCNDFALHSCFCYAAPGMLHRHMLAASLLAYCIFGFIKRILTTLLGLAALAPVLGSDESSLLLPVNQPARSLLAPPSRGAESLLLPPVYQDEDLSSARPSSTVLLMLSQAVPLRPFLANLPGRRIRDDSSPVRQGIPLSAISCADSCV